MANKKKNNQNYHIKRIGGRLHKVTPVFDSAGEVISHAIKPLMIELKLHDVMQIIVGSVILAIPVGLTEEVWRLSNSLSGINIMLISLLSLVFIAIFVYYNFYLNHLREYAGEYIKRVLAIYLLSLVVVALFLTLIDQCPWGTDAVLALKRIVLVGLPASMSATLSDTIK